MTTLENIEQAERLLAELKTNIIELEKTDMDTLRKLQKHVENRHGFPKYCLNARRDVRAYFMNTYTDLIFRVLTGANTGIPLTTILEIMNKGQEK